LLVAVAVDTLEPVAVEQVDIELQLHFLFQVHLL
jgi:hypothetical protein